MLVEYSRICTPNWRYDGRLIKKLLWVWASEGIVRRCLGYLNFTKFIFNIRCNQEPIIWSEKFLCARATAFSLTSLFLELLYRELRISGPTNRSSKLKPPKWHFWPFLHVWFSFVTSYMRSWTEESFHFRGKKYCKMHLKTGCANGQNM